MNSFFYGEVIGAEDNRTTPPLPLPAGIVKSEYLAARFGTKAPPPETNWNGIDSRAGNGKRRRKYHSNRNNDFENDAPPFTAIKPPSHSAIINPMFAELPKRCSQKLHGT